MPEGFDMKLVEDADGARGAELFRSRCAQCHTATREGGHKVGPRLWGLLGRQAGEVEGYAYSPAMTEREEVWSGETLDEFLRNPRACVPGTKMHFAGLKRNEDRRDVITFLKYRRDGRDSVYYWLAGAAVILALSLSLYKWQTKQADKEY